MADIRGPDVDAGSIADAAQERSLSFYFRLTAMQFTVVNLFTAGLYAIGANVCGDRLGVAT